MQTIDITGTTQVNGLPVPPLTDPRFTMTPDEQIAEMRAMMLKLADENSRLKAKVAAKPAQKLSLKVSEKGGVSLYGTGRFPVTLYASQWERVLAIAPEIKQFLADNAAVLARKDGE